MPTKRPQLSSFEQQVKLALEHYHQPDWLAANSPLADPFFLGESYIQALQLDAHATRVQVLQAELYKATLALCGSAAPTQGEAMEQVGYEEGGRYFSWLLCLNYLNLHLPQNVRGPLRQSTIYNDILHTSRATHDRHLMMAIQQVSQHFLRQMQPISRPDQPVVPALLVGRTSERYSTLAALQKEKTVALIGAPGVGKSALGATVAAQWMSPAIFWFQIRPTINDRLDAFLLSLAHFLHKQGSSGLWQQLVADQGKVTNSAMALELARYDLSQLSQRPLLCIDEMDLLAAAGEGGQPAEHTQLLEFISGLRTFAPILLMSRHCFFDSDLQLLLGGLTTVDCARWLEGAHISCTLADVEKMVKYTGGNPRLLELCLALHEAHQPLTATLAQLPQTPVLEAILGELWQRLGKVEQEIVQLLSVFRRPVPQMVTRISTRAIEPMLSSELIHRDSQSGIALLPLLRDFVYQQLATGERRRLHQMAAQLRASLGDYTAAAYHFLHSAEYEEAVAVLHANIDTEIGRGQALAALHILQQLPAAQLSPPHARLRSLTQAQLLRLTGGAEEALQSLGSLEWPTAESTTVDALHAQGYFYELTGDLDSALVKYDEALEQISGLLEKQAQIMVQRGRIYQRLRNMKQADEEARRVKFAAEKLQSIVQDELGNFTPARNHLWSALTIAEELDDETLIAESYFHLAIIEARQAKGEIALEYFNRALEYYARVGNQYQVERIRVNMVGMYVQAKCYAKAIETALPALDYFSRIRSTEHLAGLYANMAEAHFYLNQLAQAQRFADLVLQQEEPHFAPYAFYTLGDVQRAQQNLAQAEGFYRQAIQLAQENADNYMLAYALRRLGLLQLEQEQLGASQHAMQRALELFKTLGMKAEVEETRQEMMRI